MVVLLLVAAAASLGAVSRYVLDLLVSHWVTFGVTAGSSRRSHPHDQTFPWGTFVINVSGSLLLGLVLGLATHHGLPTVPTAVLGVGFLGGYTTWSTYLWESVSLAEAGAWGQASLNLLGSLAAGLAAAAAGFALAAL
jgi:CrcB protein